MEVADIVEFRLEPALESTTGERQVLSALLWGDKGLVSMDIGSGEVNMYSSLIDARSAIGVWQLLTLLLASVKGDRTALE
jgi:hypothetical protein